MNMMYFVLVIVNEKRRTYPIICGRGRQARQHSNGSGD